MTDYIKPRWLAHLDLEPGGVLGSRDTIIAEIKCAWFDEFAKNPSAQLRLLTEARQAIEYVTYISWQLVDNETWEAAIGPEPSDNISTPCGT